MRLSSQCIMEHKANTVDMQLNQILGETMILPGACTTCCLGSSSSCTSCGATSLSREN